MSCSSRDCLAPRAVGERETNETLTDLECPAMETSKPPVPGKSWNHRRARQKASRTAVPSAASRCESSRRVRRAIPLCPHCGHLLWFAPGVPDGVEVRQGGPGEKLFKDATAKASEGNYDAATDLFADCVRLDPGNLVYVQNFVRTLQMKYGNKEKVGPMARFNQCGARSALKDAISHAEWDEALENGYSVLMDDPWDWLTLAAMATAYKKIAESGEGPDYSRFADCSLFLSKCAADASH